MTSARSSKKPTKTTKKNTPPVTPAKKSAKKQEKSVPIAALSGAVPLVRTGDDPRQELVDRIFSALEHVHTNLYKASWEYKGEEEIYLFTPRDIAQLVDDVLDEHPRNWEHREAYIALCLNERKSITRGDEYILHEGTHYEFDAETYAKIRTQLLDLDTLGGAPIMTQLLALGFNPTQKLHTNEKHNWYMCNCLVNKLWRTRKDYDAQLTATEIRTKMISDLKRDPIMAMQTNSYVYAAIKEHCCLSA